MVEASRRITKDAPTGRSGVIHFDRVLPYTIAHLVQFNAQGVTAISPEGVEIDHIPARAFASLLFDDPNRADAIACYVYAWKRFSRRLGAFQHASPKRTRIGDFEALYYQNATVRGDRYMKALRHVATKSVLMGYQPEQPPLKRADIVAASRAQISIRALFHLFARDLETEYTSLLLKPGMIDDAGQPYFVLSLHGLGLVDTSTATWDQILELRTDQHLRRQLQNLRVFFHASYSGKPRAYIEDDLARRVDDYDRARKRIGFDRVTGVLSVVLDANTIHAVGAAGLIATVFGGPLEGVAAGASVAIGKVALELARRSYALRDLREGHELAYIINAADRLQSRSNPRFQRPC